MNVAIVVNKHLTIFFARLAPHLERAGHKVYWISPSRRWSQWLLENAGIAEERILSLPDHADEWRNMPDAGPGPLADLDGPFGVTISNLILMCRNLREQQRELAYAYLTVCRTHVERFLERNAISICFGEGTWGFELLIWLVCERRGVDYLFAHTTRIPDDRFAFFEILPHRIVTLRPVEQADLDWASRFHKQWSERPRRPVYSSRATGVFKFRRNWWKELGISLLQPGLNRDDLTLYSIGRRIRSRLRGASNRVMVRALPPFAPLADRKFALLCLHVQPELSIDVFGCLHSDQAHLTQRIARLLPSTHELWVKQHVDALGNWPLGWLRKLAELPNVRLVDPRLSTFDLIRRADLVISVAGTVSYEAALLGITAVTVAPTFFSPLMAVDPAKEPDPIGWRWPQLLRQRIGQDSSRERAIEFLAWVHAQSFPGFPFDPITVRHFGGSRRTSKSRRRASWPH